VGTHKSAEIDDTNDAAGLEIHNVDRAAVSARFANARIAVDGNVTIVVVWSDGDLVAVDIYSNSADWLPRIQVDEKSSVFLLVRDKEKSTRIGSRTHGDYSVMRKLN
jgi:hypothetical protein